MNWKRTISAFLLSVSLAAVAFSGMEIADYIKEETQSDSLQEELAAFCKEDDTAEEMTVSETADEHGLLPDEYDQEVEYVCNDDWYGGDDTGDDDGAYYWPDWDMDAAFTFPDFDGVPTGEKIPVVTPVETPPAITVTHNIAKLQSRNPDCAAWISIAGTVINYPVMYKPDSKDYYLRRNFDGKKDSNGALYIAEICDPLSSDNVIVYGHNMKSGKMFAALTKYKKHSFYETHKYIIWETAEGAHTYQVMYAFTTPVYTGHDFEYYSFADAAGPRAFDAYLSACAGRALYDTGVTASYGDHLLTLSTCEYSQDNGRMLVVAKRVD